ncbi:MAG: gliding motility lipoprotein GldH [Bacteroidia bacterium]|nr:gliding motility lipoprotein GldH [Bacteroidia bacterium]
MRKWLILSSCTFVLLGSCRNPAMFDENQEIEGSQWKIAQKPKFSVVIEDTLQNTDVYLNLRNSSCYPYNNIFLFVNTTFPNGKQAKDTLECILANEKGQWLGDGLGDIWDNRILFKKNVRFPQKGTYTFEIEQAMRVDPLPCILDVGWRLEKR